MFWMLVVETIAKIRRLSLVQGDVDQGDLPRVECVSERRAQGPAFGRDRVPLRTQAPALSSHGRAWREKLDLLLSGNAAKPQRGRLTLIRIFEKLRGLGYRRRTLPVQEPTRP